MTTTWLVPYRASAFHGGAVSYAAQGMCSSGDGKSATHMLVRDGRALRALCADHANNWNTRERKT